MIFLVGYRIFGINWSLGVIILQLKFIFDFQNLFRFIFIFRMNGYLFIFILFELLDLNLIYGFNLEIIIICFKYTLFFIDYFFLIV